MSTITATPNPATGAVDITIAQDSSIAKVLRSNDYGTQEVRVAAGQFPTAATGTTVFSDYECAQGTNSYSAVDSTGAQVATTSVEVAIDMPWLLVPIAPNYSEQAQSVTNWGFSRNTNSTKHQIIGRSDPIVVLGKLGTRTGTLEIYSASVSDAERLVRVFSRGEIVLLKQQVSGADMYFTADSLEVSPYNAIGQDATAYKLAVQYTEVSRPYGNLAGALGWTFDALASTWPTFDEMARHYATFDDLTLDSRK